MVLYVLVVLVLVVAYARLIAYSAFLPLNKNKSNIQVSRIQRIAQMILAVQAYFSVC